MGSCSQCLNDALYVVIFFMRMGTIAFGWECGGEVCQCGVACMSATI